MDKSLILFKSCCSLLQTTQDAVRSKQVTLNALNKTSESLPAEYEVTTLPPVLKVKVDKLNADWLVVKELAEQLEPAPADSSVHEVFAQGNTWLNIKKKSKLFYFILNLGTDMDLVWRE